MPASLLSSMSSGKEEGTTFACNLCQIHGSDATKFVFHSFPIRSSQTSELSTPDRSRLSPLPPPNNTNRFRRLSSITECPWRPLGSSMLIPDSAIGSSTHVHVSVSKIAGTRIDRVDFIPPIMTRYLPATNVAVW